MSMQTTMDAKPEIWPGCPVTPLGLWDGAAQYLDARGQQRAVRIFNYHTIAGLFAHQIDLLAEHFPICDSDGYGRSGVFNVDTAQQALWAAAKAAEQARQKEAATPDPEAALPDAADTPVKIGSWEHLVRQLKREHTCGRDRIIEQMIGRVVALRSHPETGMTVISAADYGCEVAFIRRGSLRLQDLPLEALTDHVPEEVPF